MKEYKKIYKQKSFLGTGDVWMLCDDHLLLVKNKAYTEDYKRFFFADIKWVKLVRTKFSIFSGAILFLLLLTLITMTLIFHEMGIGGDNVFGVLFLLFFIGIVFHYLLGPPGKLIIVTHTQRDELPVKRFRKGIKLLKKLRESIIRVQGSSDGTDLLVRMKREEKNSNNEIVI